LKASLKSNYDSFKGKVDEYITRPNSMKQFAETVLVPAYIEAQKKRWITENSSEGARWKPLNKDYAAYKKKRFADFSGSGTKMMIATGSLYKAVIGEGSGFQKVVTNKKLTISINPANVANAASRAMGRKVSENYAIEANLERPYMRFGDKTIEVFKKSIRNYIRSGKK
jgi:hypothetical protein